MARTSTWASAQAGTTLAVVPPWTTPTLTVRPVAGSLSAWSRRTWWASSRIALAPCSGADAGVRGLALDLDREPAHPLARGLEAAVGQRRLENQDVLAVAGQRLDQGSRAGTADLLVRGEQERSRDAAASGGPACAASSTPLSMARLAFMSKTPGP